MMNFKPFDQLNDGEKAVIVNLMPMKKRKCDRADHQQNCEHFTLPSQTEIRNFYDKMQRALPVLLEQNT